jgi:hypothetical protein
VTARSGEDRFRASVEAIAKRARARATFLVSDTGMVRVRAGSGTGLDVDSFVSLVSAQASAARALAPLVAGREFSGFVQEGRGATVEVTAFDAGWMLVTLHDGSPDPGARTHRGGEEVAGLKRAIEVEVQEAIGGGDGARVGQPWADEAEARIDRIFGGGF